MTTTRKWAACILAALWLQATGTAALADVITSGDASADDPVSAGTGGSDGAITINNGSIVLSPGGAQVGSAPGSTGSLNVTGSGSALVVGGGPGNSLDVGFAQGDGSVIVENGALLAIDAFVSGGFSDARFNIGRGGNGNVIIRSGAQVFVRDQAMDGSDDGIFVGTSEDFPSDLPGTGTITIRDEGTFVEVTGNLAFFNTGVSNTFFSGTTAANGAINILGGADVLVDGTVSLGIVSAGRGANATGRITVCDGGTTLTITGDSSLLSIGNNFTSATGSGTASLRLCNRALIRLTGEFGGSLGIGRGESSGFVLIESGAQLDVGQSQTVPGAGGVGVIGGISSAGGVLIVNDNARVLASNLFVLQNGIVGGSGEIRSALTNLGGTILPGTSPGTLSVDGDLLFANGVYEVEVTPGGTDLLDVTGDANFLGGTIRFVFSQGAAPSTGDTISFVRGGSVTGLDGSSDIAFEVAGLLHGFEYSIDSAGGVAQLTALNDGIADFVEPITKVGTGKSAKVAPNSNHLFAVGVLTTDLVPQFDATEIDPDTVRLGIGQAGPVAKKTDIKDLDKDGDRDLRLWFRAMQTGIACGDTSAILTGQTFTGTSFSAVIEFDTVGCE